MSESESEDFEEVEPEYMGADENDMEDPAQPEERSDDEDDAEAASDPAIEITTFGNEAKYSKYERIVTGDERITTNIMSKYEMTECVSIRATQISTGGKYFVDISGLSCPIMMAKRELMMRRCPLLIKRTVGQVMVNGEIEQVKEEWNPNLMQFAISYPEVG